MNIPIIDKSNYLKGLFIIAKLDGQLNKREKDILKEISDRLGFSRDFYEETVRNLLHNNYIKEELVKFSSKEITLSFIEDAIKISISDGKINDNEMNWLKQISELNKIETSELNQRIDKVNSNLLKPNGNSIGIMSII